MIGSRSIVANSRVIATGAAKADRSNTPGACRGRATLLRHARTAGHGSNQKVSGKPRGRFMPAMLNGVSEAEGPVHLPEIKTRISVVAVAAPTINALLHRGLGMR